MRTRPDAPSLHLLGPQPVAVALDGLALDRHVAEQVEDEAADGVPVALGQLGVEQLVDLVDRHARVHPHVAAGERLDRGLLHVVLVDDLAHQLLDQVLERDQAGGAAVLVDDDGHVELLRLHLAHQLGDALGLGHEDRLAGQLAHRLLEPAFSARPA